MSRWHALLPEMLAGSNDSAAVQMVQKPERNTTFEPFEPFEPFDPRSWKSCGTPTRGPWELLVQLWGGSSTEAKDLVNSLCAAAGSPGLPRRERLGELFARMKTRRRKGRRKIQWLLYAAHRMRSDPTYRPTEKRGKAAARRDAAVQLDLFEGLPEIAPRPKRRYRQQIFE